MLYPDDIIHDLSQGLNEAHIAILAKLSCNESGSLLPWSEAQMNSVSVMQLTKQHFDNNFYFVRSLIERLDGAKMIQTQTSPKDRRVQELSLTENGYRVIQLEFQKSGGRA